MRVIRHVIVHGRVQGVGFRAFVEIEALSARARRLGAQPARRLGRSTFARRGRRGRRRTIEACRRGPFYGARVDALHQRDGDAPISDCAEPGELFSVLPTA